MAKYETLGEKAWRVIFAIGMGWVLLFMLGVVSKLMWRVIKLGWSLV